MDSMLKKLFDDFVSLFRRGIKTSPEQPAKVRTETITWTLAQFNAGQVMPLDFSQILGGPARFLRVVCNVNCQVFFKNYDELKNENISEEKQDFEGLVGLTPRLYTDENIGWYRVVPAAFPATFTYYASRIVQED